MRDKLIAMALAQGFDNAQWLRADQIVLDRAYRALCESNACGLYGKCFMCPPDIGDIDALIAEVRGYCCGLLYQSISQLEDSFDFEGMQSGGQKHSRASFALDDALREAGFSDFLHLSKGGCGACSVCAKTEGKPCRFPRKALSSLEAYGVNVSETVKHTSMKYINGINTVTYFGLILFKENVPCPD